MTENSTAPHLLVGILLAAGHSRRYGTEDKLMQTVHGNTSMAMQSAQTLLRVLPTSIAVVGVHHQQLAAQLKALGIHVVTAPPENMMADSLVCGVQAALAHIPDLQGLLIALADMPCIQPDTLLQLTQALQTGARIVRPVHRGQAGHPVGFHADFVPQLLKCQGDQGAKSILQQYSEQLVSLTVEDEGVLRDIDTPAQLAALRSGHRLP